MSDPAPVYTPPADPAAAKAAEANAQQPTPTQGQNPPGYSVAATPYVVTPGYLAPHSPNAGPWASGLFDCCDDPETCLWGLNLHYCVIFKNAANLEGRNSVWGDFVKAILLGAGEYCCTYFGLPCFCFLRVYLVYKNRKEISTRYNIGPAGVPALGAKDILSVICCSQCAECQHMREIKYHGDDSWGVPQPKNVAQMKR